MLEVINNYYIFIKADFQYSDVIIDGKTLFLIYKLSFTGYYYDQFIIILWAIIARVKKLNPVFRCVKHALS